MSAGEIHLQNSHRNYQVWDLNTVLLEEKDCF